MFWGDGNVLYLDHDGDFATICACENLLNSTLKKGKFYYKQITRQ